MPKKKKLLIQDPSEELLKRQKAQQSFIGSEAPKKDLPIKEIDKPAPERTGIFDIEGTGKKGFTLPDGRTFFGLNTDDIAQLEKTAVIQNAQLQRQQEIERQKIISRTEIPQGRELGETAVGAFKELGQDTKPRSLLENIGQLMAGTPLGQAFSGKHALDELKKGGRADNLLEMTDFMLENGLRPDQVSDDPHIQMVLSLELNEHDIKILRSGKADISKVAQAVEGITFTRYGAKLLGKSLTPTTAEEKIVDLELTIVQIGNSIRDWRMAAARTPTKKPDYLEMVEDAEQEIRDAESKIKLLTIQSPVLQNAPEKVQTTQAVIDRQLNRLGDARNAMIFGETLEQAIAVTDVQVTSDAE